MSSPSAATLHGTQAYRQRFTDTLSASHFRHAAGLWCASLGLGTYLGEADDETDRRYAAAIKRAVECGCNVLDTAINYRHQRSERVIGRVLADLNKTDDFQREEIIVATKGGYLAFDAAVPADPRQYVEQTFLQPGLAEADDIVDWNCIAPAYINAQVEHSLDNLGLNCIDIYYVHNPEVQLHKWSRPEFMRRLEATFSVLETKVAEGKIQRYGTATWSGYRQDHTARDYLSLSELVAAAERVGGKEHHFQVIQLPYNFAMLEALTRKNQPLGGDTVCVLEAAHALGITVMVSAPLLQGQLTAQLPQAIRDAFDDLSSDTQRALQFTRSTPGVTTALVGMKSIDHVEHNLELGTLPPAAKTHWRRLFQPNP